MHSAVGVVTHPECASIGVPGGRLAEGAAALPTDPGHSLGSLYLPLGSAPLVPGIVFACDIKLFKFIFRRKIH